MESASQCNGCRSYFNHLIAAQDGDSDGRLLCTACNEPRKLQREFSKLLQQQKEQEARILQLEQTLKCADIKHKFEPCKEATTLESAMHDGCPYVYLKHGYKCTGCGLVTQM